jgi:tetratricopeptide (TPR) repeat protein
MDKIRQTSLVLILLLCFFSTLYAQQPGRLSEKEVNLQKLLIDASREKMLGNYESAAALLQQVLKEEEKDAAAAYELARVYEAMEKRQQAVEYAERAVKASPENIWYHHFLADLFQNYNENKKAAAVMERLVELEPENDTNYYRWAYFLVRAGNVKEAVKVYDQLEKQSGLSEDIVRRKHALYLGIGDYKKAAAELERLIEAFPSDVDYRHLLASFYEQIDEPRKAKEVYQQILAIEPDNAKAKLALTGAPEAVTDEEQYLASLQSVFSQPDVPIDLKIGKIIPFVQKVADTGDARLAQATLQLTNTLEKVHPSEAKSFAISADLLYHSGQKAAALEKYQKARELDDTVFLLWEQVMHIYNEQGEMEQLLTFSEQAFDYFPNQAIAYYYHSKAAYQLGQAEDAVSLLQQAALMAGKDELMKLAIDRLLGKAYNEVEDYERANALFERLMAENSNSPEVLTDYAFMLAQRGQQLSEAEKMARKATKSLPTRAEPLHALALTKYQQKQYTEAKNLFSQANQYDGGQLPQLLEHYGDVLFELGEIPSALEFWKQSRAKGRSTDELNKKIAAHSN